jgi:p-aminobenzoyl-glutamate transporter AbgT
MTYDASRLIGTLLSAMLPYLQLGWVMIYHAPFVYLATVCA